MGYRFDPGGGSRWPSSLCRRRSAAPLSRGEGGQGGPPGPGRLVTRVGGGGRARGAHLQQRRPLHRHLVAGQGHRTGYPHTHARTHARTHTPTHTHAHTHTHTPPPHTHTRTHTPRARADPIVPPQWENPRPVTAGGAGAGTLIYANGNKYEGQWLDNKRHGARAPRRERGAGSSGGCVRCVCVRACVCACACACACAWLYARWRRRRRRRRRRPWRTPAEPGVATAGSLPWRDGRAARRASRGARVTRAPRAGLKARPATSRAPPPFRRRLRARASHDTACHNPVRAVGSCHNPVGAAPRCVLGWERWVGGWGGRVRRLCVVRCCRCLPPRRCLS